MTTISGVPSGNLLALDKSKLKLTKLSADDVAKMESLWNGPAAQQGIKADNDPSNVYATVKAGGKVIATLYNSGASETSNAVGAQVGGLPSMGADETLTGPALAQKRADDIASALGGTVEKAPTAQTAAQWQTAKAQATVTAGTSLASTQDASAKTKTDAQIIAQMPANGNIAGDSATGTSAVDKFMSFMDAAKDGPAAFFRAQFLASQGLTEDDVKNMSPKDRDKLEQKIEDFVKKKVAESNAQNTQKQAAASNTAQDLPKGTDPSSKDKPLQQQPLQQGPQPDSAKKSDTDVASELASFI